MDRYARQRLLAAVGDRGQQRIFAATHSSTGESALSSSVARDYLERAGARHFAAASEPLTPFAHDSVFRHAAAREFAEGAWRALGQLVKALERGP